MNKFTRKFIGLCGFALLPALLQAADAPVLRDKSYEVGGFLGITRDATNTKAALGGNVTYALTKRILPYAEYTYFPARVSAFTLGGTIPTTGNSYHTDFNLALFDIHGGVHYRIIIHENRTVPYLVAGVGLLHTPESAIKILFKDSISQLSFQIPLPATNSPAINFGGGVRYYATQRFGFRLEAKVYKPFSDLQPLGKTFAKVEAGFFIQIR